MRRLLVFLALLMTAAATAAPADSHRASGYLYLSPLPGSARHGTETVILARLAAGSPTRIANLPSMIAVRGERSGQHAGVTTVASDGATIRFVPERPFVPGETVTVALDPSVPATLRETVRPFTFTFRISDAAVPADRYRRDAEPDNSPPPAAPATMGQATIMPNGVAVPSDYPHLDIAVNDHPSGRFVFLNSWGPPNYVIILDPASGSPVWYWQVPDRRRDFKVQPNGWLTMMVRDGYGGSGDGYIALDDRYAYVKTFRAGNGYWTDEHELQVLPDGGWLIIGRREDVVDMSLIVPGGQPNAIVRETCIQEYTRDDQLIFQWRAWDHFDIRDLELDEPTWNYIRFPHMNAIEIDDDGHILLSSRHLSEVTKIHRQSGDVIWRMRGIPGDPANDLTFVNDRLNGFRNQHAIRSLGNGRYTLFDNGNLHSPGQSRAVEYQVDTTAMTATLVWEHAGDPANVSHYMGNVQRLPDGNTHINWALGHVLPIAEEVRPDGSTAFSMRFQGGYHVYRSFRFPWSGQRVNPDLILESGSGGVTAIFNQFGDSTVSHYRIYADTDNPPATLLDTSRQTLKRFTNLVSGQRYFFRVTAVDGNGVEGPPSEVKDVFVNIIQPGANVVRNGTFDQGQAEWIWEVSGSGNAQWIIENGVSHIAISNGGNAVHEVQLRQNGLPLEQGRDYIFEFDAWAAGPRLAEIKVGQDSDPWINYSRVGFSYVTATPTHFRYDFTMQEATDFNARVVINAGNNNTDLYIDNIVLREDTETGIDAHAGATPAAFTLLPNYPNPFNPVTVIPFRLARSAEVRVEVWSVTGERVAILADGRRAAGTHRIAFDATGLASGIYFYRLTADPGSGATPLRVTRSMVFIQ